MIRREGKPWADGHEKWRIGSQVLQPDFSLHRSCILKVFMVRNGDIVCLDISEGSIYITDTGYRIGEGGEETSFDGIYKISGNTRRTMRSMCLKESMWSYGSYEH